MRYKINLVCILFDVSIEGLQCCSCALISAYAYNFVIVVYQKFTSSIGYMTWQQYCIKLCLEQFNLNFNMKDNYFKW